LVEVFQSTKTQADDDDDDDGRGAVLLPASALRQYTTRYDTTQHTTLPRCGGQIK
jgi:hypothetical protein